MSEINITNLPATANQPLYQGDAFAQVITIKEDGVLVDIDDDQFTLIANDARGNEVITLAIGSGITIVGTGKVQWELTAAETDALPTNCDLKYAFRWVDREKTIEVGTLKVIAKLQ